MKLCFIICGQPRCVDVVINNINTFFNQYQNEFHICLTKNYEIYEKEYVNKFDITNLYKNRQIKLLLFNEDIHDNSYRNSLNYFHKVSLILQLVDKNYDFYFIIRSDFVFNDINFFDKLEKTNIYFDNKNINQFTIDINDKINDNIIITGNIEYLNKLVAIYTYTLSNNNYADIILYKYVTDLHIKYQLLDINYKLVLSLCNIIAIAGDSGSGKSTLLNFLEPLFAANTVVKFETDRYHKWERGDEHYNTCSHLNPLANHLEKMSIDVYNLKVGNEIYTVDYNHVTGKFTTPGKIESKGHIILCGLHTLYMNDLNNIINLKIFMDTDRNLIRKWKIQRDVTERGYSLEKVLKQLDERENDYDVYIKNQKQNADIIIRFYEHSTILKCNVIIKNKLYYIPLINLIIKNKYNISHKDDFIILELSSSDTTTSFLHECIIDDYYKEIKNIIATCLGI